MQAQDSRPIRVLLARHRRGMEQRQLSEIKRQDIEDWLAETEWSGRTRKNYLVTLTTVFTWATDREYSAENPAAKISRPILDENAPGILTPVQAEALLQSAKECLPEMVAPIAIGLLLAYGVLNFAHWIGRKLILPPVTSKSKASRPRHDNAD